MILYHYTKEHMIKSVVHCYEKRLKSCIFAIIIISTPMITVKMTIAPPVAEYIRGKFYDDEAKVVRFPAGMDIYVLIYDLLQKRPANNPVDTGNIEFALPERRMGKDPVSYNYLSGKAQKILGDRMRLMMWAELHDLMDDNKHINGIQFKDSVFIFMRKYSIESISEDALLKNYQRWRDKQRRKKKRAYTRK